MSLHNIRRKGCVGVNWLSCYPYLTVEARKTKIVDFLLLRRVFKKTILKMVAGFFRVMSKKYFVLLGR